MIFFVIDLKYYANKESWIMKIDETLTLLFTQPIYT